MLIKSNLLSNVLIHLLPLLLKLSSKEVRKRIEGVGITNMKIGISISLPFSVHLSHKLLLLLLLFWLLLLLLLSELLKSTITHAIDAKWKTRVTMEVSLKDHDVGKRIRNSEQKIVFTTCFIYIGNCNIVFLIVVVGSVQIDRYIY